MVAFKGEFSYDVEEFGETVINADDAEQAEMFLKEYVYETYPEGKNVVIDSVKEID